MHLKRVFHGAVAVATITGIRRGWPGMGGGDPPERVSQPTREVVGKGTSGSRTASWTRVPAPTRARIYSVARVIR